MLLYVQQIIAYIVSFDWEDNCAAIGQHCLKKSGFVEFFFQNFEGSPTPVALQVSTKVRDIHIFISKHWFFFRANPDSVIPGDLSVCMTFERAQDGFNVSYCSTEKPQLPNPASETKWRTGAVRFFPLPDRPCRISKKGTAKLSQYSSSEQTQSVKEKRFNGWALY